MKTIALQVLMAALFGMTSLALSQQAQMKVSMRDGSVAFIPLDQIQKITFSPLTGIGAKGPNTTVIRSLLLLQNYPNPFNPTTEIQYDLPHAGTVQVDVFTMSGQLVVTMEQGYREAGAHQISWNGRNGSGCPVASGVYFYQARFENSVVSRKMLLIR